MNFKRLLWAAGCAAIAWSMSLRMDAIQSKYQNDIDAYAAYVSSQDDDNGDAMPSKAHAEKTVKASAAIGALKAPEVKPTEVKEVHKSATLAENIVSTAFQYIGVPYRSGSSSPKGFDCSGFTSYVFKQQNIQLTRSSRSQYTEGQAVKSRADLQKGDLVFFGGSGGGNKSIGHVGIVTEVNPDNGTFKFIHASRTGIKVDKSIEPYYSRRYVGARRVLQ